MEVDVFDAQELLVARTQQKPKRVNNGSLAGIVLADQRSQPAVEGDRDPFVARAEQPEILDS
jgi:hypothetical protein